ncbi:phenylalanine--tRNA ligase subunit beta [Uliginosibacterium sp. 31-16]|uniref:phenylalanine--tRNA ligase subunit beta n=1 Tax=Uliginosibacterium sp. 31-16 TaxID=3068315 RepID=UPI00273D82E0|nr:phenylalanine--tRNA ligase subunit beta [Uliginosibacterium sp. 31-16]MDP5241293.1 phenylalanine--tRNA ligase subunit beta [Uliginosibacterium sp. 31-16]
MQFSEQWLRALCNPPLNSEELCHLLTMAGLEVEEVEAVAPPFTSVVVAQIVSFEKHPNADKLRVCRVDVGRGELLQIVCGAPNVVEGMKAPCAMVGAKLPGFEIKPAKLRGMESFGMMCSADELGMSQDHDGLLVLPADAPVGASIREYLALDDKKITIKLTPNRADCLSLAGVARELAALTGTPATLTAPLDVAVSHAQQRSVVLDAPEACPRYCGRIFTGVNAKAATPDWMKARLERCGVRSISAVVDITNYVMLELGQPLHAFDNAKLSGAIHVRWPQAGEKLTLLNGQEIEPAANMLLIADEARALALAGVMGGEDTGVSDDTTEIFLESAFFQPDAIVGRARALNFSSDASHRYERGVDFELAQRAMARASQLIVEICGAAAGPVVEAASAVHLPQRKAVNFRPDRARKVLGFEVSDEAMLASLSRLGMCTANAGAALQVIPPSYRFDIEIEEDLIEEVARVYGYDNIQPLPPKGPAMMLASTEATRPVHRLRRQLAAQDYQEVISYAFVEEAWERDFAGNVDPVKLANPIASQMSVMRSSLVGGLVGALSANQRRRASRVRLFEVGRCFAKDAAGLPVSGYSQPVRVAGLAWGPAAPEQWGQTSRRVDFYDVKRDVELLLGGRAEFVADKHPAFHPGRSAAVKVDGTVTGFMGELHPALVQRYDLVSAPVLFELDLEQVLAAGVPSFAELPRHPAVMRDLALVVGNTVTADVLLSVLRSAATGIVREVAVFDVYSGKGIEPDQKSIALRVMLQHAERTLEETEIDNAMRTLISAAERELGGRLRA